MFNRIDKLIKYKEEIALEIINIKTHNWKYEGIEELIKNIETYRTDNKDLLLKLLSKAYGYKFKNLISLFPDVDIKIDKTFFLELIKYKSGYEKIDYKNFFDLKRIFKDNEFKINVIKNIKRGVERVISELELGSYEDYVDIIKYKILNGDYRLLIDREKIILKNRRVCMYILKNMEFFLKNNKIVFLPELIRDIVKTYKDDKEIIENLAYCYLKHNLKYDSEYDFEYDNKEIEAFILKNSREFLIEKKLDNIYFEYNVSEFAKDEIVEYMKNNGLLLKYLNDELKDDKEIVLEAVKNNGKALLFASDRLKDNKEIVMEAIKNKYALCYASDRLKKDRDIALEAVKYSERALFYLSDKFLEDKEVILKALNFSSKNYFLLSEKLKQDKEVIIASIESLEIKEEYVNDREIFIEMLKKSTDYDEFKFPEKYLKDLEVLKIYFENNSNVEEVWNLIDEKIFSNYDIVLELLKSMSKYREDIKKYERS